LQCRGNAWSGKRIFLEKGVGRVGRAGQVIFAEQINNAAVIAASGIIYPVVAKRPFQPFYGMWPLGTVAGNMFHFSVKIELKTEILIFYLGIPTITDRTT
jgi:hypothetical protein